MAGLVPAIHVLTLLEIKKSWMPGTRPGMTVERKCVYPGHLAGLLAAICAHASHVALERMALAHLEPVSPEILWKCDLAPIERLSRSFTRAQLQTFALDADRRRNDASAILHRASARDLVVNILAPRIDILRGQRSNGRDQKTGDRQSNPNRLHETCRHLDKMLSAVRGQCRTGDQPGPIGGKEHDATSDLLRLAQATNWNLRQYGFLQHIFRHGLHHFGVDVSRANRIHCNAGASPFLRKRFGEAKLACLGGRIVGLARLPLLAIDGGDVDDAAKLALTHALDERAAHVEQRTEICIYHRRPLLGLHAVKHGVARDTGIVNKHLDRTELSFDLFDALGAGLVGRHIPFEYRDAGLGLELLSGLVIAAIVGRNLVAGRF